MDAAPSGAAFVIYAAESIYFYQADEGRKVKKSEIIFIRKTC